MKKIKMTIVILALFITVGTINFSSYNHRENPYTVSAALSNPAAGASYYATNENDLYYSGIDESLVGNDLIVDLSTLTSTGFVSKSYSSLPNIYRYSDVSLTNSNKLVMVYTGSEVSFTPGSMPSKTNKEHVWPASWYGNGSRTESAGSPGADAHNVWPSASELNSKRGASAFNELNFSTSYKCYEFDRNDWSYGTVGNNDTYVWSTAFNYSNGQSNDALYPAIGHRGQIARTLMYIATRYRNNNTYPVMLHDQAATLSSGRIGKLSLLLKWHFQEPPSEWEINRNNEIASRWHHNRNPFIDHPEYASKIYYYLPEPGSSSPTAAVKNVIETYGDLSQGIALDKQSITLNAGQFFKLNIVTNPNNETVTWSSDNPNVATVDNNGNVTAINSGTTAITAQGSQSSDNCVVTVTQATGEPTLISDISFTPSSYSMEIGNEIVLTPTISPTIATNKSLAWNSLNTGVAVVDDNGRAVGVSVGSTTITTSSLDGSNKSSSCTITVTPQSINEQNGWSLIENHNSLSTGDRLAIASNTGYSAGDISTTYMNSLNTTFSIDKQTITSLNANTVVFTLHGSSGSWTFENESGELLGAKAVKSLAWDEGTTTWSISIANNNATIQNSTTSYGRILYNVNAPRFTTYTSDTSPSMLLPQIYRYNEETEDAIKNEAYDYVSIFMTMTANECAAFNVHLSTWTSLSNSYDLLSSDVKNYIYEHSENDLAIMAMINRYSVIANKYNYVNFLIDNNGDPFLTFDNYKANQLFENSVIILPIFLILLFVISSVLLLIVLKKKRIEFKN